MGVKVVKFGGSSLADANQFRKVANIIKSDDNRRFVVPSAPGKRFSDDIKITDMLYACYDLASKKQDFSQKFNVVKDRYNGIIADLGLDLSLDEEFEEIERSLKARAGRDYAASRGEYLNGIVLAKYLGFNFIDAGEVIFFDEKGNFMLEYGLLSQKQQELDSITSSLRNIWNDKQYEYFCNHLILPIKNCLQQHEVFISSKISSMEKIESQIESVASKY